ncbi:hypothetical protein NFIA_105670 [Paecilomyces variotii No. 5]|uniref:Uncharacterized protein n=1 Tax=Byssochlamys spectabilis (strain No. 5 / NBRC 109023) TaxID=1356009 RepID=V5FM53_BYSSN|nr:hypothetical protein NFIA_105670 [Paecilomyces variotii No. 5]
MAALDVPDTGLSLRRDQPDGLSPGPSAKTTQIMRLNLAQSTLDELVQSLRNEQKARIRLGRHQTLYYGSKAQHFRSSPEAHRSEIYSSNPADKENMYFTGVLSHSLEVQKAKEATAATDEALANLEQSLNAFERGKESKKTHMITNILDVKALGAGDNRSSTGKQAARLARMPTSKIDVEKEKFFKNAANRSIPTSPALGVARSPASVPALTPTSAPSFQSKDRIRLEALKVPFIHLLAIRAVSVKFLARQTRASQEDCLALARKYGTENRLDRDKFDLKDKTYRDLDVWNFPYPSQEDRQEAIENAISAFDRMRISRSDKLWQMLLPKEERGKGKVLSRLDLSKGPIKKAVTPRIQIQPSEDTGKEGYATGNETDRTNGRHTPNAAAGKLTPKLGPTTQKKRVGDKDGSAKRASTKAKNTTLTGRVTKKTEKKSTAKPDGKFKSAEYVHDSDEDDTDMADAPPPKHPEPEKVKPASTVSSKAPTPSKAATDSRSTAQKAPKQEPDRAHPKPSSSTTGTGSKTVPNSSRPSNSSPQKPSPLASSPPTNASDLDSTSGKSVQNASSSSSSPLITQLSKNRPSSDTPRVTKPPVKVNGAAQRLQGTGNPLKRKAGIDHDTRSAAPLNGRINGHLEAKRRRPPSVSSGSSTGSASPPLSQEILRQQLREKSQRFKQYYTKYHALHEALASQADPPRAELDKLERQHARLQRMKKEIWDEDRRLRSGI